MATDLDRAWEAINGMAKPGRNLSTYEDGWNDALAGALGIIEALGGRDPCTLPKEECDDPELSWELIVEICRPVK